MSILVSAVKLLGELRRLQLPCLTILLDDSVHMSLVPGSVWQKLHKLLILA